MSFLHLIIILLTVVEIVVAILLICLILAQKSKSGGGLGGIAGGGATEEVFGSQGANVLMKATIYFSIFFFINTLGLAVLNKFDAKAANTSVVEQQLGEAEPTLEAAPAEGETEPAPIPTPVPEASAPAPASTPTEDDASATEPASEEGTLKPVEAAPAEQ